MSAARMRYVASICVLGAAVLTSPCAFAAQCRSVGGHINGEQSSAVRTTSLKGSTLHLSGRMDGKPMPRRALDCMRIQIGLMCGAEFGPVSVSVMTRGKQMVETVTATDTGAELAGFSYECDRPVGR